MKKIIFGTLFLIMASATISQTTDDYIEILRTVLKTEKKAAIADAMTFTEQESTAFWPLYNEFDAKEYEIQTKRVEIIKDFAANFETMTDEKADELWTSYMRYKQELLNLNKQYYKKFKQILPAGKAAKYFQAENKIAILVDFQLSAEIPFIETK